MRRHIRARVCVRTHNSTSKCSFSCATIFSVRRSSALSARMMTFFFYVTRAGQLLVGVTNDLGRLSIHW